MSSVREALTGAQEFIGARIREGDLGLIDEQWARKLLKKIRAALKDVPRDEA